MATLNISINESNVRRLVRVGDRIHKLRQLKQPDSWEPSLEDTLDEILNLAEKRLGEMVPES
jgi:hypothetical protein